MHGAASTFSKAVIPSRNYRGDSFSTKDTIDSIAGPTLDIMDICSEGNKIVLVYHSYVRFYLYVGYKIFVKKDIERPRVPHSCHKSYSISL